MSAFNVYSEILNSVDPLTGLTPALYFNLSSADEGFNPDMITVFMGMHAHPTTGGLDEFVVNNEFRFHDLFMKQHFIVDDLMKSKFFVRVRGRKNNSYGT